MLKDGKLPTVVKNSEEVPKDGKICQKKWQKIPNVAKKDDKKCPKKPTVVKSLKRLPKHLTFDDICHKITFAI